MRKNSKSDFIILAGGEIPIKANKGKGGRTQHFTALMIPYLKDYNNSVFAGVASDGKDCIEGISGAMINNGTIKKIAGK